MIDFLLHFIIFFVEKCCDGVHDAINNTYNPKSNNTDSNQKKKKDSEGENRWHVIKREREAKGRKKHQGRLIKKRLHRCLEKIGIDQRQVKINDALQYYNMLTVLEEFVHCDTGGGIK